MGPDIVHNFTQATIEFLTASGPAHHSSLLFVRRLMAFRVSLCGTGGLVRRFRTPLPATGANCAGFLPWSQPLGAPLGIVTQPSISHRRWSNNPQR